jgi:hypothetical protein
MTNVDNQNIHLVSLKNDRDLDNKLTQWPTNINSAEEFFALCLSLASRLEDEGLEGLNKAFGSLGQINMPDFLNIILFLRETNADDFEKVSTALYKTNLDNLNSSINHFLSHFDVVLNTSVSSPKIYALAQTAIANLLLDLFEIKLITSIQN